MKINENLKIIISSKTCDKTKTTGEYGFFKKIFRYHVNKAYILSSLLQSFLISFFFTYYVYCGCVSVRDYHCAQGLPLRISTLNFSICSLLGVIVLCVT